MPKIYKRHCNRCGEYYEGQGDKYCSKKCYGKSPISKETRKKLKEKRKGRRPGLGKKYGHISDEKRKKLREQKIGNKNPSYGKRGQKSFHWKGGIRPIAQSIRDSDVYLLWRQRVLLRDNFTCQGCGSNDRLEAAHKKSFKKLLEEASLYLPLLNLYDAAMLYTPMWEIDNGITYCRKCHVEFDKRRDKNARDKN